MEKKIKKELKSKKLTWLITGSNGFIGINLVKNLVNLNQNVIGIDVQKTSYIHKNYKFIQDDLKNIGNVKKKIKKKVNFVLHQASLTSVPNSIKQPELYLNSNFLNFKNILDLSKLLKVRSLVYASSSSIYGNRSKNNFEKNSISFNKLNKLTSPYAQSKKIIEEFANNYKSNFNLIGLRYFNVFGPYQKIEGKNLAVIPNWINLIIKKKPLVIYGNGKATRNFIYIDDVVNANIISALTVKKNTIFNICSSKSMTLKQLLLKMRDVYFKFDPNYQIKISYAKFREGDVLYSKGSNFKAKKFLYFKEALDFKKALTKTFEWQIKVTN